MSLLTRITIFFYRLEQAIRNLNRGFKVLVWAPGKSLPIDPILLLLGVNQTPSVPKSIPVLLIVGIVQ